MKIKAKELRQMKENQLKEKLTEVRKELMKLNSQIAVGTVPESPGKVKQVKKTIARILTIINEKKREVPAATKESSKQKEETKKQ